MESGDDLHFLRAKMQDAEVEPGEHVWGNIHAALDKDEEVNNLKKRLFYFQWASVAAAILLFGLGFAAYRYMNHQQIETQKLSEQIASLQNTNENVTIMHEEEVSDRIEKENELIEKNDNVLRWQKQKEEHHNNQRINKVKKDAENLSLYNKPAKTKLAAFKNYTIAEDKNNLFSTNTNFRWQDKNQFKPSTYANNEKVIAEKLDENIPEPTPILVDKQQSVLALEEEKSSEEKIKQEERFWTSVGFSAGSFNNITPTTTGAPANTFRSSLAGQTASEESNSPGYTYAVNVLVGAKLSERWILQGGVSYLNQVSDYTANSVLSENAALQVASVNQFEKNKDNTNATILATTPYTVNNSIEIISFPVQAGYVLFEKKWGFIINTGISTDLFLQNTVTPNAENIASITTGRGSESPYRPVNFAGLIGSEISYRFGTQYRISLAPGIRYPFQSIYKDRLDVKSTPLTFDLGLRFKYIFK